MENNPVELPIIKEKFGPSWQRPRCEVRDSAGMSMSSIVIKISYAKAGMSMYSIVIKISDAKGTFKNTAAETHSACPAAFAHGKQ